MHAQHVFDIDYLIVEILSDFGDSSENTLDQFQHFVCVRPMVAGGVALRCVRCVIKDDVGAAVACWLAVDSPDSSASKPTVKKRRSVRFVRSLEAH